MKTTAFILRIVVVIFLLSAASSRAVIFTNNTSIGALDVSYDGADIVISNCTVTLDGAHGFNSLLVANGGVLTHSCFPNATSTLLLNVTDEPQVLVSTNPVTLAKLNVFAAVTVSDTNHLVTYTNDVDFVQYAPGDGTTQIYRTETSSIPDGVTVLVSYTWPYSYGAGLTVIVTNDVNIAAGGSINANGIGYGPALGSGRGFTASGSFADGSGAGHGGSGGMSLSNAVGGNCYGTLYQPTTLGSGGGASYLGTGGNGGGKIQISAGGTVNIDGLLTVNGADATNSRAGGGAGGSIWITATNVTGAGTFTANGGAGEPVRGGGGGGGRISIQCGTNYFSGSLTAFGGNGAKIGGAGTIFIQTNGATGRLLVDNGGRAGTNSLVILGPSADVFISGGAGVKIGGGFNPHDLTIGTNGSLTGNSQSLWSFSVSGDLTIQSGGAINFDSLGASPGLGNAPGNYYSGNNYYPASGGGYGGYGAPAASGGINGGPTYGSQTSPNSLGSGGGNYITSIGGSGGGAVTISVAGALRVDGKISANGGNGSGTGGGGGSGGSIYVANCASLTGNGSITANGGNGVAALGGGGGGGRISIVTASNSFSGIVSTYGGGGASFGGAGTIYSQVNTPIGATQQLVLDNGGHLGTNTTIQSLSSANLTIRNGAKGTATTPINFLSLLVSSNGWLTHGPAGFLNMTIAQNGTIEVGGGFMGDNCGRAAGQGNSPGGNTSSSPPYYLCGGGGYGGRGGNSFSNSASGGGNVNDSAANPSSAYSGSGGGNFSPSIGGPGGGFFQLTVNGKLQLDGVISANGGNGSGISGGGGAGGGVYLTAGTLAGSGVINANGGSGANGLGGGGGGGRIAIYFSAYQYNGALTAFGGAGGNYGGAGTIYLKTNSIGRAQIIVDNAGHVGADTTWSSSSSTDLILRNGGGCYLATGTTVGNLTVGSNSWLIISNAFASYSVAIINAANVTVQSGGIIHADLTGYAANAGTGLGNYNSSPPYYPGAGGGHGGYGANAFSNLATGGVFYDNVTIPLSGGSGGGGYSIYSLGGKGGGVISLQLQGNLQVDGKLSANGGNGGGNGGGGGAGGSLNISCTALNGGGILSANGGSGANGLGGGGSGGIIFASFASNLFSGNLSAYGGGGANYGGAGIIYLRTNAGQSLLIVDNAGHRGTNTPLANANHFQIRNGATAFQAFPPQSVTSLLITSNAWLIGNTAPGNNFPGIVNLTVLNNATILAGGGISCDAAGSAQNSGIGHGDFYSSSPYYPSGGAGHGGYGAQILANYGAGGSTYDSTLTPTTAGSGGGGNASSIGGAGGGFIRLQILGALQVDGTITANGGNGLGTGGGGGSGGSIYLSPFTLNGSGSITANGGNGASIHGGGGGGGRIAAYFNSNNFAGSISTFGGGGAAYGGAGTIYLKTNSQPFGLLVLDNNNNAGTNSSFDTFNMDVTIQNRAVGLLPTSGSWTAHNILIRTNGTLTANTSSSRALFVNNLTIDNGGALSLDNTGSAAQTGSGAGITASPVRGGAGHGGYGGGNLPNSGRAYDSIILPSIAGSGGASSYNGNGTYNYGGSGGGALSLFVTFPGTLTVNGRLSANGGNGDYNAGGGSGGSLNFSFINKLSGTGIISANGGSATGSAGGGGGGRIAFNTVTSNNFSGQITAFGGNGLFPGGAGTIYYRGTTNKTLLVDNGGINGTNTPLGSSFGMPTPSFDLNISGGAVVVPVTQLPLINNLNLAAGSKITVPSTQSNLFIAVLKDATLAGSLTVDNLGYAQATGPGAGTNIANKGSGAGYGGTGGDSSSFAVGGATYGSAAQPVDFGSGGGSGINSLIGGSEGGGAVRMSVGGNLNIDGNFSANGDFGWQDDSGGGSGGSIWISANSVSGVGTLSAAGGNGDLWNGGGGGGGRIAIYSPTNSFAGYTNVSGGFGAMNGSPGTIFLSGIFPNFFALAQSPTGTVNNTVSAVDVSFNDAVDPASVNSAGFTFTTPLGVMDSANLSASAVDATTVRIYFPVQNLNGNYSLTVTSGVANIFGQPLAQAFTGNFAIAVPTISGTVRDINGATVSGVTISPDVTLPAVATDMNGNYSLGVPPGWSGNLTASLGTNIFIPSILGFADVTASLTNQNFLMVSSVAPALTSSFTSTNFTMAWQGIPGVTYSVVYSEDLVNWTAYGGSGLFLLGTNAPMEVTLPIDSSPALFFRLNCLY